MTVRSMTGFGAARRDTDALRIVIEARSVNGRFLKTNLKMPTVLNPWEGHIEQRIKQRVGRGTVSVSVSLQRTSPEAVVNVNADVVQAYQAVFRRLGVPETPLATLPGVIGGPEQAVRDDEWQTVAEALDSALDAMVAMREREGQDLSSALTGLCEQISQHKATIAQRAPDVVREYQHKLHERLTRLLQETDVTLDAQQLAREVAIFADRCDITEELERLEAHIGRTRELLAGGGQIGRTLEFLAQEMHREANTMGSKSADAALAHAVVALKAEIERFKEQVANIE